MTGYLIMALLAALAAAIAVWRWQQAAKRREALFTFATARGWSYAMTDHTLLGRWVGAPFSRGDNRRVTNVLRGTVSDRPLVAFDYSYDEKRRSSKGVETRTTYRFSVVALGMPAYLPSLAVTPESVVHRLGDAVGATDDIEFESEDFNRRYRVSARNARFATDVLTPRTMELLVARPSLSFRFENQDVISCHSGALTPLDLLARASTLDAVLDGIPDYLWRDHGAEPWPAATSRFPAPPPAGAPSAAAAPPPPAAPPPAGNLTLPFGASMVEPFAPRDQESP